MPVGTVSLSFRQRGTLLELVASTSAVLRVTASTWRTQGRPVDTRCCVARKVVHSQVRQEARAPSFILCHAMAQITGTYVRSFLSDLISHTHCALQSGPARCTLLKAVFDPGPYAQRRANLLAYLRCNYIGRVSVITRRCNRRVRCPSEQTAAAMATAPSACKRRCAASFGAYGNAPGSN